VAYEFQKLSGRAGVSLTSETLATNLTMLALMQGDVAKGAVMSVRPRVLPVSAVGDNATVDTDTGPAAGTVVWEESDGQYRVVEADGKCYFQESSFFWGWTTVKNDSGGSISCSESEWNKNKFGAFSAVGRDMSALAGQLNLSDFRQSFMDSVMSGILDKIKDQIRNPMDFLGNTTYLPVTGGRSVMALGKLSTGITSGAVLRSGAVLDPADLQSKIRNVLIGMTDAAEAKRKITTIAVDYFARAKTLAAPKAASSNA
jgi:hypothetical protein